EEIAEAAGIATGAAEIAELESARCLLLPARRRPEIVARVIAARAHVVVSRALLLVVQDLIGLAEGLELVLGAGFLVLVRVVLARELAVRRLDLVVAGALFHAEGFVVVLELHSISRQSARRSAADRSTADLTIMTHHPAGLVPDRRSFMMSGFRSCAASFRAAWESRFPARRVCLRR